VDLEFVMGIGNYYLNSAESVYIAKEEVYGEDFHDEGFDDFIHSPFFYEDLICHIIEALPKCFRQIPKRYWLDRERLVIAESGLYRVSVVDWDSYFSINIEVIDDTAASSLAKYHLDRTSSRIFDELSQIYCLRIRTSAWTSGERSLPEWGFKSKAA
jgi:hypothetical protein